MAEKPIIFSAPMVRAILEGRKTQTRRLLAIRGHRTFTEFGPSTTRGYDWHFRDRGMRWHDYRQDELMQRLPYSPGDLLWVREALERANGECVGYPADGTWLPNTPWRWSRNKLPSIHMPRWASRITLKVTGVKVERLHAISEDDAKAEGVERDSDGWCDYMMPSTQCCRDAKASFKTLWLSIHGPESWSQNPWVVAISFERTTAPEGR